MLEISPNNYNNFELGSHTDLTILDHMGGFNLNGTNSILDQIQQQSIGPLLSVSTEYIVDEKIKNNYPGLSLKFNLNPLTDLLEIFQRYKIPPNNKFNNFICSFNGTSHVSRKLLTAILNRYGFFDLNYSSKNFIYSTDELDGHIQDFVGNRNRIYNKFFLDQQNHNFYDKIINFDYLKLERYDNVSAAGIHNILKLEQKLTESFLHIVSETMATSYYPFVTEKFLYSVITQGLFLAYAQPGWHQHLEKYFGFKLYIKLFDYRFDTIENPVERLVELISMISKFSVLSADEWKDLYLLERDTIEYNYDHYFSRKYLTCLGNYSD